MSDAQSTQDVLGSYGERACRELESLYWALDPDGFLASRQQGFFFDSK
jgi:hypothetical protein